jgi:hypothetical protein
MNNQPTKDDLWKVLRGEYTMPEVLRVFGKSQDDIDEVMGSIGTNAFKLQIYSVMYKSMAYMMLRDMNEIDESKIYNFATNKYDNEPSAQGDFGLMCNDIYRFTGSEWQILNQLKNE